MPNATPARTRRTNGVLRGADIPTYVPDMKLSLVRRIANFLDWCARYRPYEWLSYNEITKAILGFDHGVRDNNPQLLIVKKTCSRAKKILNEEYNRGYVSLRHHGIRAAVDDNDRAKNVLPGATIRLQGAVNNFKEQAQAIDSTKVTDPAAKRWLTGPVKQMLGTMGPDFVKLLAPPSQE